MSQFDAGVAPLLPMPESPAVLAAAPSRWRLFLRRLFHSSAAIIGVALLSIHLFLALFGEAVSPYPPLEFHYDAVLSPPSATFLAGTDEFGRDVLSRVLSGARSVIAISFLATALGVLFGTAIGLTSGYLGGRIDEVIMRLADILLSFPSLLLALLILTSLGSSVPTVIACIAIIFIAPVSRIMRSVALEWRSQQFILAAQARGESTAFVVAKELLPNAIPPIVVETSIRVSYAIPISASLGFLGLGVQPPDPDWGLMIYGGRNLIPIAPWIVIAPAIAISSLVIGANLFADAISHALDRESRTGSLT